MANESVPEKPDAESVGGDDLLDNPADSWDDEKHEGSTTPTVTEPRETDAAFPPACDGQNELPGVSAGDDETEENTSTKETNPAEIPSSNGGNDLPAVGSDEEW